MANKKFLRALTVIELLVSITILSVFVMLLGAALNGAYLLSTTAVSAQVLAQLSSAGNLYLGEHNNIYWSWKDGNLYWFGLDRAGTSVVEGARVIDTSVGPLSPYLSGLSSLRPDPSFTSSGKTFKPKYQNLHLPFGYNSLLKGINSLGIKHPGQFVIFATCAQVNNFQPPASAKNPMIEEFYEFNATEKTIHFRHAGKAMVAFATGAVDFIAMDENTRDTRLPTANVGTLASKYVNPSLE